MKIATLTMNPTIDMNSTVENVVPEQKLRCGTPEYEPGGGGLNVSRAVKNLGGNSLAIFPAGGSNGDLLKKILTEEKTNYEIINIKKQSRLNVNILEEKSGKQFRFIMPGPELEEDEWKQCIEKIKNLKTSPEYLVISGSLPPGVQEEFFSYAAQTGEAINAKVIIDSKKISLNCLKDCGIFMIKPNLREFQKLTGEELSGDKQITDAALKIINEGKIEVIVISMGAGGAMLVTKDGSRRYGSPSVPVISKVGAGDSMTAGIVFSLSKGNTLTDAVKYGISAGAAAVMTPGTELCRKEDTERLYKSF